MLRLGPTSTVPRATRMEQSSSTSTERRTSSRSARRSSTTPRTTSSTDERASRMSSPTSRIPSRCTGARSSRASARWGRAGSSGARGFSAGPERTSSARCLLSPSSRTRYRSWTTSADRRPTWVISLRRRMSSSSCRTGSTTSARKAKRPGPTSPRRSSRRQALRAGFAELPRPNWIDLRRGPPTRSFAASIPRRRAYPTGAKASEPLLIVSASNVQGLALDRSC
jgi:hypothetical protein